MMPYFHTVCSFRCSDKEAITNNFGGGGPNANAEGKEEQVREGKIQTWILSYECRFLMGTD